MKPSNKPKALPVKVLGKKAMKTTKGGGIALTVDVTIRPAPAPIPTPYPNIATTTPPQTGKKAVMAIQR